MYEYNSVVNFFTKFSGGRTANIHSGYTPNAIFDFDFAELEGKWDGAKYSLINENSLYKDADIKIIFEGPTIIPGEPQKVIVQITEKRHSFVGQEMFADGKCFIMREGVRAIGSGVFL